MQKTKIMHVLVQKKMKPNQYDALIGKIIQKILFGVLNFSTLIQSVLDSVLMTMFRCMISFVLMLLFGQKVIMEGNIWWSRFLHYG